MELYTTDHKIAMQVVLDVLRSTGAWPVLQHVHLVLAQRGVRDPVECVRTAPARYLRLDGPGDAASHVWITVHGLYETAPRAPELSLFVGALRGCVDAYRFYVLDSPSRAQTLVVAATDLVRASPWVTPDRLMVIGRLFEAENIAPISFEPGGDCPWRIALDMGIWRFQGIAELIDYLSCGERKDALAS